MTGERLTSNKKRKRLQASSSSFENSTGSKTTETLSPVNTIPQPQPQPLPPPEEEVDETPGKCMCAICHDKAVAPFSSRCGHICCLTCWNSWLKEQLTCPVCRERVRQKQLTKLYFI